MSQGKLNLVKKEIEHQYVRNQWTWNGREWVNLIQMTIISTAMGYDPLEEMEEASQSIKESEMQYLGAIPKTTEWSWFVSKANNSISQ